MKGIYSCWSMAEIFVVYICTSYVIHVDLCFSTLWLLQFHFYISCTPYFCLKWFCPLLGFSSVSLYFYILLLQFLADEPEASNLEFYNFHQVEALLNMGLTNFNQLQQTANGVILVSLLFNLNIFHTFFSVSIVNFEQLNAGWAILIHCNKLTNSKFFKLKDLIFDITIF